MTLSDRIILILKKSQRPISTGEIITELEERYPEFEYPNNTVRAAISKLKKSGDIVDMDGWKTPNKRKYKSHNRLNKSLHWGHIQGGVF